MPPERGGRRAYSEAALPDLIRCAETSAIAAMIMSGGKAIAEMAVIGTGDLLCTPCGGCRQKIREFAKGNVKIHMCGEDGNLKQTMTLDELLPASFGPENLV